jgi:hypothetical protein
MNWIIKDWTGKVMFPNEFDSFDDAEEYLCIFFDENKMDYEEWSQEYYISVVEE